MDRRNFIKSSAAIIGGAVVAPLASKAEIDFTSGIPRDPAVIDQRTRRPTMFAEQYDITTDSMFFVAKGYKGKILKTITAQIPPRASEKLKDEIKRGLIRKAKADGWCPLSYMVLG